MEELLKALKSEENKKLVEELVKSGKKESESLVEVASKLGYEVTADELGKAFAETRELDDEELEKVSGGIFWFGDDAPNGHEVGCLAFYYNHWDDYYQERDTGRCVTKFENPTDLSAPSCKF